MKPQDFKIIFMGTPEFAVASLDALITSGFNVVGVITATDKPAGRGKKIKYSAVKEYALQKELTILQPPNLKAPEFHEELQSLGADLFVVVAFRMLPEAVWQMPAYGTINLHGSLLPQYRGAAPINWAVINGEKETGVTTFFIQKEIDTGNIIKQESIAISQNMTAGELHDEMMMVGAQCLTQTVHSIQNGTAQGKPQKDFIESELKGASKLYRENCEINWRKSALEVHNHIRGLSPFPGAWTILMNEHSTSFKILKTLVCDQKLAPGEILVKNGELFIGCSEASIQILELQMQGKKRMDSKVFLNGYSFDPSVHFKAE